MGDAGKTGHGTGGTAAVGGTKAPGTRHDTKGAAGKACGGPGAVGLGRMWVPGPGLTPAPRSVPGLAAE